MTKSINKLTLIGNVGKDPEIRYTASGMAVASFSVATEDKKKDGESITQWHNCVAFDKLAGLVEQYVRKGSKLYLEGKVQYQQYEKDGINRTMTKIVVNEMSFLSSASETSSNASKAQAPTKAVPQAHSLDDDIPF